MRNVLFFVAFVLSAPTLAACDDDPASQCFANDFCPAGEEGDTCRPNQEALAKCDDDSAQFECTDGTWKLLEGVACGEDGGNADGSTDASTDGSATDAN